MIKKKKFIVSIITIFVCLILTSCNMFGTFVENSTSSGDNSISGTNTTYPESQVQEFTISFQSNGGNSVPNQKVKSGNKVTEPSSPEKEGYRFVGWYTDSNLTKKYNFNNTISSNFTLYAKWEKNLMKDSQGLLLSNQVVPANTLYSGYITDYQSDNASGNKTGFLGFALDITKATTLQSRCLNTQNMVLDLDKLLTSDVRILRLNDMSAKHYIAKGESLSALSNELKSHFKVSSEGKVGFLGNSVAVGLTDTYNTFTSSKKSYHNYFSVVDWIMNCYQVNLQTPNGNLDYWDLTSLKFQDDVQKLNNGSMSAESFLNKYGTHILTSANLGGYYSTYTYYHSESSFETQEFESICEANIEVNAAYKCIQASSSLSTLEQKYTNTMLQANNIRVEQTCMYAGGESTYLTGNSKETSLNEWAKTIPTNPTLTSLVNEDSLLEVYEIIPSNYSSAIKKLKSYYKDYVSQALQDFQLQYNVTEREFNYGSDNAPKRNLSELDTASITSNTKVLNIFLEPNSSKSSDNYLIIPSYISKVNIISKNNNPLYNTCFIIEDRSNSLDFTFDNCNFICGVSDVKEGNYIFTNAPLMKNMVSSNTVFDINIHFKNTNSFISQSKTYSDSSSIFECGNSNIFITSDKFANVTLKTGNANNGSQYCAFIGNDFVPMSGKSGSCIIANSVVINMTSSTLNVETGNGGNGYKGANGGDASSSGEIGDYGGSSGDCFVVSNSVKIIQNDSSYTFKTGNGGNAGSGGDGYAHNGFWSDDVTNGGNGGNGGNSGSVSNKKIEIVIETGNIKFISVTIGTSGKGGLGGKGGKVGNKKASDGLSGRNGIVGVINIDDEYLIE